MQVLDLLGNTLIARDLRGTDESIDVTKLRAGTYFLRLTQNGLVKTRRLVVEH